MAFFEMSPQKTSEVKRRRKRRDRRRRFAAIAVEAERQVRLFNPQGLANTSWAFAKAAVSAPTLFAVIATEAERQVRLFNPQELANTSWAFAKAVVSAPTLFAVIATEAERYFGLAATPGTTALVQVRLFNPQELADTSWAFATAGVSAPKLFAAIAVEAEKQVQRFNPQELANTSWAFATTGVSASTLFAAIAVEAEKQVQLFTSQNLANTSWAFAKAAVSAPPLFAAIAAAAEAKIGEFTSQGLSMTLCAFSKVEGGDVTVAEIFRKIMTSQKPPVPRPAKVPAPPRPRRRPRRCSSYEQRPDEEPQVGVSEADDENERLLVTVAFALFLVQITDDAFYVKIVARLNALNLEDAAAGRTFKITKKQDVFFMDFFRRALDVAHQNAERRKLSNSFSVVQLVYYAAHRATRSLDADEWNKVLSRGAAGRGWRRLVPAAIPEDAPVAA